MVFRGRHPRIQPLSALPNIHQIYAYAWFLLNSHFMEPAVHTSCYMCFLVSKGHWPTFLDTNWTGQKWMIHDTWYRIFNEVFQLFLFSPTETRQNLRFLKPESWCVREESPWFLPSSGHSAAWPPPRQHWPWKVRILGSNDVTWKSLRTS